jgi:hypothetical protein
VAVKWGREALVKRVSGDPVADKKMVYYYYYYYYLVTHSPITGLQTRPDLLRMSVRTPANSVRVKEYHSHDKWRKMHGRCKGTVAMFAGTVLKPVVRV